MYGILKVSWGIDESHIYFYVYVYFDAFSGVMWLTIVNKILIFEEKISLITQGSSLAQMFQFLNKKHGTVD